MTTQNSETTTNAVQCIKCGTINPRFYIKCKKCSKKLDQSDPKVYDPNIDKKSSSIKWTPGSLIIFAIVFGTIFYFGLKLFGVGNDKNNSSKPEKNNHLSKTEFIEKVKENQAVIDADITDVKFLYISVVDDGINKNAMAIFYCRLAKEYSVIEVQAVKIVDAASAYLPKNGTAAGKELGKSFCN